MSKASALATIDRELGVMGDGSAEYEALKEALSNCFSSNILEELAEFLEDENR